MSMTLLGWIHGQQEREESDHPSPDPEPITKVRADDYAAPHTAVRQDDRSCLQSTGPEETRVRQDD